MPNFQFFIQKIYIKIVPLQKITNSYENNEAKIT